MLSANPALKLNKIIIQAITKLKVGEKITVKELGFTYSRWQLLSPKVP
jgi:hypothetical protein